MNINEDMEEILKYAHFFNWAPDWCVVQKIYNNFQNHILC